MSVPYGLAQADQQAKLDYPVGTEIRTTKTRGLVKVTGYIVTAKARYGGLRTEPILVVETGVDSTCDILLSEVLFAPRIVERQTASVG